MLSLRTFSFPTYGAQPEHHPQQVKGGGIRGCWDQAELGQASAEDSTPTVCWVEARKLSRGSQGQSQKGSAKDKRQRRWKHRTHTQGPSRFSRVRLFVTPQSVASQASLSMGSSRQEYWSGLPCPPPGDLPGPGIEPVSLMPPALACRFLTSSATWGVPNALKY